MKKRVLRERRMVKPEVIEPKEEIKTEPKEEKKKVKK
jgi:hypothetical protein